MIWENGIETSDRRVPAELGQESQASPLDCKEIQPVHPKGNQCSLVFIGRTDAKAETPVLWPPDAKS